MPVFQLNFILIFFPPLLQYPDIPSLPRNVCESCFDKARDTYLFQQLCYSSLGKILQQSVTIAEPVDLKSTPPVIVAPRSPPPRATVRPSAQVLPTTAEVESIQDVVLEEEVAMEDQDEDDEEELVVDSQICVDTQNEPEKEEEDPADIDSDSDESSESVDLVYTQPITIAKSPVTRNRRETVETPKKPVQERRGRKKNSIPVLDQQPSPSLSKGNFGCGACGVYFDTLKKLRVHTKDEHEEANAAKQEGPAKIYMCTKCLKKFESAENLCAHDIDCVDAGNLYKPFVCNFCQLRFKFQKEMKQHQVDMHADQKRYPCPMCDMKFTRSSQVTQHLRVHTQEKPFECEVCQAMFSKKANMLRHIKKHKEETMFVCSVCDKSFKWETSLKVHMNSHSQARMYKCEHCERDYGSMSGYKKHMSTAHKMKVEGDE